MAGDSSYTPLYSGQHNAIFSMAEDDLYNKDAFFHSIATLLRQHSFPDGSAAFNDTGKVWAFFEGVVNSSPIVFELVMESRSSYRFSYNLGEVQRSGFVEDLKDIWGILP